MTETSHHMTVIDRYRNAVAAADRAAFVDAFTDDCVIVDPYPDGRYVGTEGVEQWWDTLIAPMTNVDIEIREHQVCGNRVAAAYTVTGSPEPGVTVELRGIDIFTIAGEQLAGIEAYWDPTTLKVLDPPTT